MNAREQRRAAKRFERAKAALAKLTEEERRKIFREMGSCACSSLGRVAADEPLVAIGAVIGGILGAAVGASAEPKKDEPRPVDPFKNWLKPTGGKS